MKSEAQYLTEISQAKTPESIRNIILSFGFTGLFFQRWYADRLDIWEALQETGFLELYHGSQIYKHCPVAQAIYSWSRDYTFAQAREKINLPDGSSEKSAALFRTFGGADGIVFLTGDNDTKAAVIALSEGAIETTFKEYGPILSYAARKLTNLLPSGHSLLQNSNRSDSILSETQRKIIQMQIDHPHMSNAEVANNLDMSVNTLLAHHKKIAKKIGAPSFTGAVVRRLQG